MPPKSQYKRNSFKPRKINKKNEIAQIDMPEELDEKITGYNLPSALLPDVDKNLLAEIPNLKFSQNIIPPSSYYGFMHYYHQTKDKMKHITEELQGKKKIYQVVNKFERFIDNYEADINNVSKIYFDVNPKPDILSRGFFKLWELLFMFDLIQTDTENFVSAHLAEGPGAFIQATMFFRDKFASKTLTKNDKYYAVTLHSEDEGKHVPQLEKNFVEYYSKEKPQRFILHKTYSKQEAGASKLKDNGDITNPKTILLFGGAMREKPSLITADGGFDWSNENAQEQEAYRLIFGQIVAAVQLQSKGGNFVCKFFESFTSVTIKFMYILSLFYDKIYLVKPFTSRSSNSEKYAVCLNYKFDDKNKLRASMLNTLNNMLTTIHDNSSEILNDMFFDFNIPKNYLTTVLNLNITIANQQFKEINRMVKFIDSQNYYGDEYQKSREQQIEASKFWTTLFYPDKETFNKSKEQSKLLLKNSIKTTEVDIDKLAKTYEYG